MSLLDIRSRFHTALDGVGLLLHGAPNYLAYRMGQQSIYGNRFASGDRSYDDLSKWWYFAQTDWSGGVQTPQPWVDTQYYFSTNIDAYSVPGTLRLARQSESHIGYASPLNATCATFGTVGGLSKLYIGTDDDTDGRPNISSFAWTPGSTTPGGVETEIAGASLDTSCIAISQMITRGGRLWSFQHGTSSNTSKVMTWDGATWTDMGTYIQTLSGVAYTTCNTGVVVGNKLYVFVYDSTNGRSAIVSTTAALPTTALGVDWTLTRIDASTEWMAIDSMPFLNGFVYLLIDYATGTKAQLRYWDIADGTESILREFVGAGFTRKYGYGGKLLKELGGNVIITIPTAQVWAMNQSFVLTKIYDLDLFKTSDMTGVTQTESVEFGCVEYNACLWWGNLLFDGEVFHNTFRDKLDDDGTECEPLVATPDGYIFFANDDNRDVSAVRVDKNVAVSLYKSTADVNYIVLGNIDTIQAVDKFPYSVTMFFDKFGISGEEIAIDYCTDVMSPTMTWTELGAASFDLDGNAVTSKVLYFPTGTTFKKLWFRIRLNGPITTTPILHDFVMEYLPMPNQKKEWSLTVNAGDHLKDLYGTPSGVTGRELRALVEQSWMTKSALDYQDLDYGQTLLNGSLSEAVTTITVDSTAGFNDRGRLRIDNEEILYTGKTGTTFTGCTRGARGTEAASHSDNATCSNAYKVLVSSVQEQVPVMLKGTELEYTLTINLREV